MVQTSLVGLSVEHGLGRHFDTLSDESVQVLVVWSLNSKVSSADVVDSFVVDHEGAV